MSAWFPATSISFGSLIPSAAEKGSPPCSTVMLDSVGDSMCCSYGDGSAARYATVDDSNVLIYIRQHCASYERDKEHGKSIVHRIPNDYRIANSARAAIMLSQCLLSLK
jgi:serine/threonine protein phosphatase PrpC